ncbi:MAG: GatB/YqeY domain-containing protein [Betaproteobacteria bacterium]
MSLTSKIQADMRSGMKSKNANLVSTIRLLLAAIKQQEIDKREQLTDSDVLTIVERLVKQRRESIQIYTEAGRNDLASKESAELEILTTYLPKQLSDEEVELIIQETLSSLDAREPKDMGKVMAALKTQLSGKADLSRVSTRVRELLS